MSTFFNPDNSFWRFLSKFFDVMGLSLCWLICSLPVLTLGAATVALYDSVSHCLRGDDPRTYGRFFTSFKANFKTATLATLPALAGTAVFYLLGSFTRSAALQNLAGAALLQYVYLALGFFLLCIWLLALAILSRFDFKLLPLLLTAFRLTFAHLPSALLGGLVVVVCMWPCVAFLFPLPFLPAVAALAASFFYERIFAPFLPRQEDGGEA